MCVFVVVALIVPQRYKWRGSDVHGTGHTLLAMPSRSYEKILRHMTNSWKTTLVVRLFSEHTCILYPAVTHVIP